MFSMKLAALDAKLTMFFMNKVPQLLAAAGEKASTEGTGTYTEILNKAKGNEALQGEAATLNNKIAEAGNSTYKIVLSVVTVALLIVVVLAGAALAFSKAQDREEAKKKLVYVAGGTVVAFAAVGIITYLAGFGNTLLGE